MPPMHLDQQVWDVANLYHLPITHQLHSCHPALLVVLSHHLGVTYQRTTSAMLCLPKLPRELCCATITQRTLLY